MPREALILLHRVHKKSKCRFNKRTCWQHDSQRPESRIVSSSIGRHAWVGSEVILHSSWITLWPLKAASRPMAKGFDAKYQGIKAGKMAFYPRKKRQ